MLSLTRELMMVGTYILITISAIWIYFDAKHIWKNKDVSDREEVGPRGWAILTLLLGGITLPLYVAKRFTLKKIDNSIDIMSPTIIGVALCVGIAANIMVAYFNHRSFF